ncbi:unnamed protein product [Rotaria magnacalcarata]
MHLPAWKKKSTTAPLERKKKTFFDEKYEKQVSDLVYGWLNLNSRFDTIVHSCPIRQVCNKPKWLWRSQRWFAWSYPTDAELLQHFASQVVSLEIHQHLTLSGVNKINILQYPNLRRLTIRRTTTSQVNAIQVNNFPYLEYLTLSATENISFNILCQFKLLRSCDLGSIQIDDQDTCSSSSIRPLILHLRHHLPQLISFKVSKDPIDIDRCGVVSTLLPSLSPDQRIRCHLNLFGRSNFNFEQFQRALWKLNSCRLSYSLTYYLRWHSLPDFDHIRQLSLFHQIRPGPCNSDKCHTYNLTWTIVHENFQNKIDSDDKIHSFDVIRELHDQYMKLK